MIRIILYLIIALILLVYLWFTLLFGFKPYKALWLSIKDKKKKDKTEYPHFGFWLYTNLGGSGKTISMVNFAYEMKKQYPNLFIATNISSLWHYDELIKDWKQIVTMRNPKGDKYGVLILLDEIHITLSSQSWKKAPDNLLEYISQQRKLYKHIIASSQSFNRVNIVLREQTNYIIECRAIFGARWIFNSAFNTATYSLNGDKKDLGQKKRIRTFRSNFVATDFIRSLYDTYETQVKLYEREEE